MRCIVLVGDIVSSRKVAQRAQNRRRGESRVRSFSGLAFGDVPARERQTVRKRLGEYCKKDTMAMVEVVEAMGKMCGKSQ